MPKKYLTFLTSLVLIIYFGLFFSQKISLITADLGRHIINGKVFLTEGKVVSTNFYSYTQPDFPTVTHHWFSGVIFYLVQNAAGFKGLSYFYFLVSGLTVFIFFKVAQNRSNFYIALFFALLVLPLAADRKEIRPEGFSYLLMGLYYYLFSLYTKKKIKFKFLLPIIFFTQVLWVNLHIFFVMGIFISGVYLSDSFIKRVFLKKNVKINQWVIIFAVTVIASLVSPYGIKGFLEPFSILKEYGYMIIENQTVFFMQKRAPSFKYIYFEILSALALLTTASIVIKNKWKNYFISLALLLAFLILSFRAIRGIPMFALFFIPFASEYFHRNFSKHSTKLPIFSMLIFIFSLIPGHFFSFYKAGFGFGLIPGVNNSADFYKNNSISGPIFNNYDIGGYLIYHLYGEEKIFVDNRPESYSVDFFKDMYIPAQENEKVWKEVSEKYDFNSIYFYRRDATPWAQPFLIQRIKDPEWVPVYVDNYVLILVRNTEKNQGIIKSHALPDSMFVARPS